VRRRVSVCAYLTPWYTNSSSHCIESTHRSIQTSLSLLFFCFPLDYYYYYFCFWFEETLRLESNRLQDRVPTELCTLREDNLIEFIVDCVYQIGSESFGVVCPIPDCCTECTPLVGGGN
jgi:hypothetical protein